MSVHTLTYNLPNDINTYVITCNDDLVMKYFELLRENGAYKILLDNQVIFNNY